MSTTLMMLAITTGAFAAPAPSLPTQQTVGNDGYVFVYRSPLRSKVKSTTLYVCPVGHFKDPEYCGSELNWNSVVPENKRVEPVTPQQALDLWFGVGKTAFVGIGPGGSETDYIFYRILQK